MSPWFVYALIGEDKEIKNIGVYSLDGGYTLACIHAVEMFGEGAIAVEVSQYPVQIGDTYDEGRFYRIVGDERIKIEPYPTEKQEIIGLKAENESLNESIDDIIIAITPTEVN